MEISCYHFVFVCFHVALFWDHVLTCKELCFFSQTLVEMIFVEFDLVMFDLCGPLKEVLM